VVLQRSQARFIARTIDGSRPSEMFGFVEPMFPTLVDKPPSGSGWIHEIKYDGYRVQAHVQAGRCRLYTRRGHDWTDRFGRIASDFEKFPVDKLIVDGEIALQDSAGRTDFSALQHAISTNSREPFVFFAFDLLYLDGFNLRASPLWQRKDVLKRLFDETRDTGRIRFSDHIEIKQGDDIFARACEMGLEGIVSKKRNARYGSGRTKSWLKAKCSKRGFFPIVAFVEKLGAKPRRIASLYLGRWEDGDLLYAGKARSGYTDKIARETREILNPLIVKASLLDERIKKPKATWVRPEVQAEIEYSAITADGLLRAAVFKGLRELPAKPAIRRTPKAEYVRGVRKENILQLLPDAVVPSPAALETYWQKNWRRALRYLGNRPLKLVRHVKGTTFYHKGPLPEIPKAVHQLKVKKREGSTGTRLWIDDLAGLLGLVEIGAIELHPWNATVDDIEHADVMVFDLDPGEGVSYEFVIETALALRTLLANAGFRGWPKVTGGKGLHVMVPLTDRGMTHDASHRLSKAIAQELEATNPERYTLSATATRRRLLFIDYLRNGRGTTAIGTFSPRARRGFPIAAPVTWRDIEKGIRPDAFTISKPTAHRAKSKKE
jgi:bifunctional non-homologous end joining protein LigD